MTNENEKESARQPPESSLVPATANDSQLSVAVDELLKAARDEDILMRLKQLAAMKATAESAIAHLAVYAASKRSVVSTEAIRALEAISADWRTTSELASAFPLLVLELKRLDFDRAVDLFRSQPHLAIQVLASKSDEVTDDLQLALLLRTIAQVLAVTPDPSIPADEVARKIEQALFAEQVHVRREAAIAITNLGYCTQKGLLGLYRMLMDEPDLGVRQQVVRAVGKLVPNEDSAQLLVWRLADTDEDVATEASLALKQIGERAVLALSTLLERTRSLKELQQQTAKQFCQEMGVSIHRVLLEDVWETAECRIVETLGAIGPTAAAAIPPLLKKSKTKDPALRAAIAQAFGCIDVEAPGVTERLILMLVDNSAPVRGAAQRALNKSASAWTQRADFRELVASDLVPRLDRSADIELVSKTLCNLGDAAVPILTDHQANVGLYDADSRIIREHCAKILGKIGQTSSEETKTLICQHLNKAAENENEHGFVRKAAKAMLGKIEKTSRKE